MQANVQCDRERAELREENQKWRDLGYSSPESFRALVRKDTREKQELPDTVRDLGKTLRDISKGVSEQRDRMKERTPSPVGHASTYGPSAPFFTGPDGARPSSDVKSKLP